MKKFDWLLIICLTLFALIAGQHHLGIDQDAYYLPAVFKQLNPSLYPNDIYVNSLNTYVTYFYAALAAITKLTSLNFAFLSTHLISIFLFILGLFLFSRNLFKSSAPAILASLFLILPKPALGGINVAINHGYIYQTFFAFSLSLISLWLFFTRRYPLAFILAGFIALIQSLMAIHLMIVFNLIFLFKKQFSHLKYSLFSLPFFLPLVINNLKFKVIGSATASFTDWLTLNRLRSSHHLFPDTWSLKTWVAGLWPVIPTLLLPAHKAFSRLKLFSAAALVSFIPAYIFTSLYPIKLIIQLQFFRSGMWLTTLGWLSLSYLILKLKPLSLKAILIFTLLVITLKPANKNPLETFALSPHDQDWLAAQIWLKDHTPQTAKIYLPLNFPTFRAFSQRSTSLTWPDMTTALADDGMVKASLNRLNQPDIPTPDYQFAVYPAGKPQSNLPLYQNSSFAIYPL